MPSNQLLRVVDYGPYRAGENPGGPSPPTTADMDQDLSILSKVGNAVRIYTVEDNQSYIVYNAAKYGLQVIPSVFLDNPNSDGASDPRPSFSTIISQNAAIKQQLDDLIAVLNDPRTNLSNIPFVVIGNEEITQVGGWYDQSIIDAIDYVKSRTPSGIKFTTAEPADIAQQQYVINNPASNNQTTLGQSVDVIYANILPYWESLPIDQAVSQVVQEYNLLVQTYPGKRVVISETGWPSGGSPQGSAVPSLANEQTFWQQFIPVANQYGIEYGAFEGFDEAWKATSIPGNSVDANWGLFGDNRAAKTTVTTLLTAPCYVAGTNLAGQQGEVRIDKLVIGDVVRTLFAGLAPVVWIGRRLVDCRRHPEPHKVWPICVYADAFGDGLPLRNLWLSPDHAVFVNDVLIPIRYLINDISIAQLSVDEVIYYHIELAKHDVLVAEGMPAESYLDTGDRSNFENVGNPVQPYPDFSTRIWEASGCAPLVIAGAQIDATRQLVNKKGVFRSLCPPIAQCLAHNLAAGCADLRARSIKCMNSACATNCTKRIFHSSVRSPSPSSTKPSQSATASAPTSSSRARSFSKSNPSQPSSPPTKRN